MVIGFIIWSIVCFIFIGIGISSWRAKKAVGFFSNIEPPKIAPEHIKSYNHAVAVLWFAFSVVFELCGLPLLFAKQNSAVFAFLPIVVMLLVIGTVIAYLRIERKYSSK